MSDDAATTGLAAKFPVAAIGASAGGIEALQRFFTSLPADPGMAFIVVLHLSPDQFSHLPEILSRWSKLPVEEITGDVTLRINRVYAIAPDQALVLEDDVLRIRPAGDRPRHPIDTLFKSMADSKREQAIAVVLSGTGANGAAGVLRVKEQGGVVFVQEPETADHDGMPRAAISTGVVDRVLAPEEMPGELIAYCRHMKTEALPADAQDTPKQELLPVLTLLRARIGHDFRPYKAKTLLRRTQRRMGLRHVDTIDEYLNILQEDPGEVEALSRDLLINVTAFFRDEAAWKTLSDRVIVPLVAGQDTDVPIRAWTPGCSTGEEAYSLAMLLLDAIEASGKPTEIKVFATDPAVEVLNRARGGRFPATVAEGIPAERLRRHFDRDGDAYIAKKRLRESIVFAPQNVLADPPFSHLDLVVCRNLLIYLEPEAQKRALSMFHFALRENGYLFLGPSESIADRDHLFEPIAKSWRLYRRVGPGRPQIIDFPRVAHGLPSQQATARPPEPRRPSERERAREALVELFAPPSVLIDRDYLIQHYHGDTRPFLQPPNGEPTHNLLRLARSGLAGCIRDAVQQAIRDGRSCTSRDGNGIEILAAPTERLGAVDTGRIIVSFLVNQRRPQASTMASQAEPADESALEAALRDSRDELHRTIDELERANEDLKASNEEISSINEEFQAANEELETSKEELQSLNEELNTVNTQLQGKVQELEERTNDLNNTLNSSAIVTLFLDSALRVRWFTPATRELFKLTSNDLGRPLTDFAPHFQDPAFLDDAQAVQRDLQPRETEVEGANGRWFLRRTQPYRTEEDRIAGVVVTFVEITARRLAEQALRDSEERFRALIEASAQIVWTTDAAGHAVEDSASWRAFTGHDAAQWRKSGWLSAVHPDDREAAEAAWTRAVQAIEPLQTEFRIWHAADETWRDTIVRAVPLLNDDGGVREWVGMNIDVTGERRADAHRQLLLDELQHRVKNLFANIDALLQLSSDETQDMASFVANFQGRLTALERTQNLLGLQSERTLDLRDLVVTELRAHGAEARQLRLDGERLRIPQAVAVVLGMVIHELATNAVKHGALKYRDARIDIAWTLLDRQAPRLVFSWRENGVPVAEGVKPGFGFSLIQEAAPYMLKARVTLDLEPQGLVCILDIPLD